MPCAYYYVRQVVWTKLERRTGRAWAAGQGLYREGTGRTGDRALWHFSTFFLRDRVGVDATT